MAARLKTGDLVVVISGKNKGKQGKIARILADSDRVVVEGINLIKRHLKPTAKLPQGGILEREAPLHASKVMPVDPKTGKGDACPVRHRREGAEGARRRQERRGAAPQPA